jgi:hypothetical protein
MKPTSCQCYSCGLCLPLGRCEYSGVIAWRSEHYERKAELERRAELAKAIPRHGGAIGPDGQVYVTCKFLFCISCGTPHALEGNDPQYDDPQYHDPQHLSKAVQVYRLRARKGRAFRPIPADALEAHDAACQKRREEKERKEQELRERLKRYKQEQQRRCAEGGGQPLSINLLPEYRKNRTLKQRVRWLQHRLSSPGDDFLNSLLWPLGAVFEIWDWIERRRSRRTPEEIAAWEREYERRNQETMERIYREADVRLRNFEELWPVVRGPFGIEHLSKGGARLECGQCGTRNCLSEAFEEFQPCPYCGEPMLGEPQGFNLLEFTGADVGATREEEALASWNWEY